VATKTSLEEGVHTDVSSTGLFDWHGCEVHVVKEDLFRATITPHELGVLGAGNGNESEETNGKKSVHF